MFLPLVAKDKNAKGAYKMFSTFKEIYVNAYLHGATPEGHVPFIQNPNAHLGKYICVMNNSMMT